MPSRNPSPICCKALLIILLLLTTTAVNFLVSSTVRMREGQVWVYEQLAPCQWNKHRGQVPLKPSSRGLGSHVLQIVLGDQKYWTPKDGLSCIYSLVQPWKGLLKKKKVSLFSKFFLQMLLQEVAGCPMTGCLSKFFECETISWTRCIIIYV